MICKIAISTLIFSLNLIVLMCIFQYNDIYNFPQRVFDKAVEAVEVDGESEVESEQEEEQEKEIEKEVEMELEADEEGEQNGPQYVEADSDDDDYGDNDDFDAEEVSMVSRKVNYSPKNDLFTKIYYLGRRQRLWTKGSS